MKIGPFHITRFDRASGHDGEDCTLELVRSSPGRRTAHPPVKLTISRKDYDDVRAAIEADPAAQPTPVYLTTLEEKPIPMLLTCPACGERHLDAGRFATHPHHTHACQACGMVWRPAKVATVGVRFLPGFKDPIE